MKILLVLVVIFTLSSCTREEHLQPEKETFKTNLDWYPSEAHLDAIEEYQKILESFTTSRSYTLDSIHFPEYYGGAFINENDKLVVLVTNSQFNRQKNIEDIVGSKNSIVKPCQYSYRQLNDIMNDLNELLLNNPSKNPAIENITQAKLMEADNSIVVELLECTEEKINEFKENLINSPMIKFNQAKGFGSTEATTTFEPGTKVYCTKHNSSVEHSSAALGYRVMKGDGTKGVVVSGHFMHEGNGLYAMNNDQKYEIIGSCIDSQESGSIDAAFCELDFSVCDVAQSPISDFPLDLNPIRSPPVGASVTKYTYTGISSGKITSTNVSARFKNGVVITNMLSADYKSQPGDSGGPIYSAAKKITK